MSIGKHYGWATGGLILAAMLAAGTTWAATTFYVSPTGSDANSGESWALAKATIPSAITAAADDDEIIVSNGTYTVTGVINVNKGVTIRGYTGLPEDTTVQSLTSHVRVMDIQHAGATVRGLTLKGTWVGTQAGEGAVARMSAGVMADCIVTNGSAAWQDIVGGPGKGGGLYLSDGLVTNTVFEGNRALGFGSTAQGGAVYMIGGELVDCIIRNNHADVSASSIAANSLGGGIYMTGGLLKGSTVRGNKLDPASYKDGYQSGGGIYMTGGMVNDCDIESNWAQTGLGGGVFMTGGTVTVSRVAHNYTAYRPNSPGGTAAGGGVYLTGGLLDSTLVVSNFAQGWINSWGGGAYMDMAGTGIVNCTFLHNYAREAASGGATGNGGGIFAANGTVQGSLVIGNGSASAGYESQYGGGVYMAGSGALESSTLVGNRAKTQGGGTYGGTIVNSIVYSNSAPAGVNYQDGSFTYSCSAPLPGGAGNINTDTLFVNWGSGFGTVHATGDYQLVKDSHAVNGGTNLWWMASATDLLGKPRISGPLVDMGCYERIPRGTMFIFR